MVDRNERETDRPIPADTSRSPPEQFVEQANVSDPAIYDEFEDSWPACWERAADRLSWREEYDTVLEDEDAPSIAGSPVGR